jgi:hypothetical protein
MSLLSKTSAKVESAKEIVSPFNLMGVVEIYVDSGYFFINGILDHDKLSDLKLYKSDNVPVTGYVWDEDICRRFAYYVCKYHIEHPDEYKLHYEDIHKAGTPYWPIVISLSKDMYGYDIMYVRFSRPDEEMSRMTIIYRK